MQEEKDITIKKEIINMGRRSKTSAVTLYKSFQSEKIADMY